MPDAQLISADLSDFKPGEGEVIPGLPCQEYHDLPGWSGSQLADLRESPELFERRHIARDWKPKPTESMKQGTAIHSLVLENAEIVVYPEVWIGKSVLAASGSRYGHTEKYEACVRAERPDATLVFRKPKKWQPVDVVLDAVAALRADPKFSGFLTGCGGKFKTSAEASHFCRDPKSGLLMKTRPDLLFFGKRTVSTNLKTRGEERPFQQGQRWRFRFVIEDEHLHMRAALERLVLGGLGIDVDDFMFCFVLREAPVYPVRFVTLSEAQLAEGERLLYETFTDLIHRLESGNWRSSDADDDGPVERQERE